MMKANDYFLVHQWLSRKYGKAAICENEQCKSVNPKRFEWALKKGAKCVRDRNSFIQMCPSCHRKYDFTEQQRENQSKSAKGRTFSKETIAKLSFSGLGKGVKPVVQKSKIGRTISKFESISIAAYRTGILQSAISNVLTNRAKTAGGFIWQYEQMN